MNRVRSVSVLDPPEIDVARLTFEAVRRAEAMGLVESGSFRADAAAVRQLAAKVRRAGIALSAADIIANVESPSSRDLVELLKTIIAALDASPAPQYEWKGLARVFAPDDLAALLDVS